MVQSTWPTSSFRPQTGVYVPVGHTEEALLGTDGKQYKQLSREAFISRLKPLLEDASIKKTGQNIKYDMVVLATHGVNLRGVDFDTMIASYLIDPTGGKHPRGKPRDTQTVLQAFYRGFICRNKFPFDLGHIGIRSCLSENLSKNRHRFLDIIIVYVEMGHCPYGSAPEGYHKDAVLLK